MDIERFGKRMIELLPQLMRGVTRQEHNYLSRGQITLPQLWALESLVRERAGCQMHEIAASLGISRPAATGLMDRLIAQGLVRREGDQKDRRIVRVRITAKGQKIVDAIWDQKRRTIMKVFGRISPSDRSQYISILERVVTNLTQQELDK